MTRRTLTLALAGAAMAVGCDRHQSAAPTPPTTQVVITTRPAASQPAKEPSPAIFVISEQPFTFPPCKLVTQPKDGALRVTLMSIDPPEAVKDGYTGNSFYFRFNLDADPGDDLVGQQFVFRNSSSETEDNTNGLFIAGKQTLRPVDVAVSFDRIDGQMVITVGGTFHLYDDQNAADNPPTVKARAMLEPAVVDMKK